MLLKCRAGVLLLIGLAVWLTGCSPVLPDVQAGGRESRYAWVVYWDFERGADEAASLRRDLAGLTFFAACFDDNDELYVPEELQRDRIKCGKQTVSYLSIVNDVIGAEGKNSLKDIEVLRRLFRSESSMDLHVQSILSLTKAGGYDGVEIDYERVWKDAEVARNFLRFTYRLCAQAAKENIKVRIVLEPGTPFVTTEFCRGPEYVVMLYNEYGLHSGPGPKASRRFIERTVKCMNLLPGHRAVAFSVGGCVWSSDGTRKFVTEIEAANLAKQYQAELQRDEDSRCLVFKYRAKSIDYEVWYADKDTLNYWIDLARQQGVTAFNIWRLGGNLDIDRVK